MGDGEGRQESGRQRRERERDRNCYFCIFVARMRARVCNGGGSTGARKDTLMVLQKDSWKVAGSDRKMKGWVEGEGY